MTESAKSVLLRFAPMIYGPTALFALGEGAVIPLIPVVAAKLGADLALSGAVASALVIGQLCGNIPAGALVARFGERVTMVAAGSLALLGAAGIALPTPGERLGVFRTMVQYRRVLSRLGLAAASMSAVRASRQVVLPLWGVSLGLDAQTILLVVGIAGAIDFALFYASGQIMDCFGRLWAALPSMLLTLGADVAPKSDPAAFLGSWRTLTDAGRAAGPVLFSALAAAVSLSVATAAVRVIGLLGALGFLRWIPMFVRRRLPPE